MTVLLSVFFGAGVAAWVYAKLGRRIGYGDSRSIWTVVGVIFVLSALFFYTILRFVLGVS